MMVRIIIAFVSLSLPVSILAQGALDALRFAQFTPVNTARVHAIGGANVSLGGDLSSAYINPAGLAQFKTSEFVFTPGFQMQRNQSTYNDTAYTGKRNVFNNGITGVVLANTDNWRSSKIRNKTIAFALNQTASFSGNYFFSGRNNLSSFSEKWVEELSTNEVGNFGDALIRFPAGSSLAVENYLVDSITSGNQIVGYRTNANTKNMPLDQSFFYERRGGIQEALIAMAWNYDDKLLFGGSIGLPYADFRLRTTVIEKDASLNPDNDFKELKYTEEFSSRGLGINARIGVIYKPVEYVRFGFAFHTPTAYELTDRITSTLRTDVENFARRITGDNNRSSVFELSTADITGGENYAYNYTLTTPWKAAISASYVFRETSDVNRQKAFITADLELVNYQSMSYKPISEEPIAVYPTRAYLDAVNRDIDALYRYALNARIGGELKFKLWMIRAGFNFIGSPYEKNALPEGAKAYSWTPSLGLGYRHRGIFIDLTASHTVGRDIQFPYILSGNNYPFATQRLNGTQVVGTIGFKF